MIVALAVAGQAFAETPQTRQAPRQRSAQPSKRARILGLAIGAGAGVAGGIAAAFAALPDASCSDSKTWIAAGSFGTLGAALGYGLAGRGERSARPRSSQLRGAHHADAALASLTFDNGPALRLPMGVRPVAAP
jgi:hypothetical protein